MARNTRSRVTVTTGEESPHRRIEIEKYLQSKHVKWTFIEDFPIADIDVNRSLANQARFEALKERVVEQYTEALQRGEEFPAIIAAYFTQGAKKVLVVDGNHRLHAYISDGRDTVPLYLIEGDSATITVMTYEANTKHGLPTTEEERTQHALWLLERGTVQQKAAEVTGLPLRVVKSAWERSKSDARARQLSIREWNTLPISTRSRLGMVRTDEGMVAASKLTMEAKLNVLEVNDMVTEINQVKGAQSQVDAVERIRQEKYLERIQESAGGTLRVRMNRPYGSFRSATGLLLKWDIESYVNDLTGSAADTMAALERAERAESLLGKLVTELRSRLED